jgi:hypothetical protein
MKLRNAEGISLIVPLDELLNLDKLPFKMTADMMTEVAFWGQHQHSYKDAAKIITRISGYDISDVTVRSVTDKVGSIIFQNDCCYVDEIYERLSSNKIVFPKIKKNGVFYIETDGAFLNTRQKGEDGKTYRENKLGILFSSDNMVPYREINGEMKNRILKKEYVSYLGCVDEFKKHLFACAIKNGYGCYKETVLVGDGATWIRNMKEELFPDALQILDYYHVTEKVNKLANELFGKNPSECKPWSNKICTWLENSEIDNIFSELSKISSNIMKKSETNLLNYLKNNIDHIDYKTYRLKGYFVGSGAVEGGNKTALQRRLKQAGMRWNVPTAQYVLTLVAKELSELWQNEVNIPIRKEFGQPINP